MKKYLWIVALVAALAMVFIGCGDGGDGPDGPSIPTQKPTDVRFLYLDGSYKDVPFEVGETTWADVKAELRRTSDKYPDETKAFKAWQDKSGKVWTNDNNTDAIGQMLTFEPAWYDGVFSGSTAGADKIYLEDSNWVVYGFDLGAGGDVKNITGIKASYGLSEAALEIYKGNRPWRVCGPYFFNAAESIDQPGTTPVRTFYGDFMIDDGGAFGARQEGNPSLPGTFNKFHSYMCYSGGAWDGSEASPTPTPNNWFTVTYNFSNDDDGNAPGTGAWTYGKTLRLLEGILTDGKDGDVQVIPANTDKTKVYFAIGVTRANAGQSNSKDGTQSPWEVGMVSFVKDVKLLYGSSEIPGAIPEFTAGGVTSKRVFSGYVNPRMYSWVGTPSQAVKIIPDPGFTPPVPSTPASVDFSLPGMPMKNPTPFAGNYEYQLYIPLDFPAGLSLGSYWKYTIRAKFFDASNTEIPSASGLAAARFLTSREDPNGLGGGQWNVNEETIKKAIPDAAAGSGTITHLIVFNTDEKVKYIEVTEVTFHP
jgi:hypothetical protein